MDGDAELKATQIWLKNTVGKVDAAAAIQSAVRGGAKEIKDSIKISFFYASLIIFY